MPSSLQTIISPLPRIGIIDIGASPIDGAPPYQQLMSSNLASVVGFEPDETQYKDLQAKNEPNVTCYPYAIGDGNSATLHVCKEPGMSSLLEPDMNALNCLAGFPEWAEVIDTIEIETKRLDDLSMIPQPDYIKLDVQGSELSILQNAQKVLEKTLVVHCEIQFVPFYKNQPLFAEIDLELRKAGFYLHRFMTLRKRLLQPMHVEDHPFAGLHQLFWTDGVYVKRFTDFEKLSPEELLKIALISNDLYQSYDMTYRALVFFDKKSSTNYADKYKNAVGEFEYCEA